MSRIKSRSLEQSFPPHGGDQKAARVAYQPAAQEAVSSITVDRVLPQSRGSDLDKKIVRLDPRPKNNTILCNGKSGPDDVDPGPAAA